jgi:hypothetical protein
MINIEEIANLCGVMLEAKLKPQIAKREEPQSPLSYKVDSNAVVTAYYEDQIIGWINVTHQNKFGKTYRALSAQTHRVLHCESLSQAKNFVMEEWI